MEIKFEKDEKGNETAIISKADYEKVLAEVKENAKAEGKKSAMEGIEKRYDLSIDEIKDMRKQIRAIKEEKAKDTVKQEYLANGGKPEYFDDFYASNKFEKTENLKEDMKKTKESKPLFFSNKVVSSVHFAEEMGIHTNTPEAEILNDGKGENLSQRLRKNAI